MTIDSEIDTPRPGCCIECDENYRDTLPEGDVRRILRPFIVCPTCGNKRCPKATLHTLACTGSNDPGQEGSAYTAGRHWTAHKDRMSRATGPLSDGPAHSDRAHSAATDTTPERALRPDSNLQGDS